MPVLHVHHVARYFAGWWRQRWVYPHANQALLIIRAAPRHVGIPQLDGTNMEADTQDKDQRAEAPKGRTPALSHRMKHDKSILALAVSSTNIFAGTQGGEILVYSLDTYERQRVLEAHRGSVLALCLSQDQALLFSSATDPIVNVSTGA